MMGNAIVDGKRRRKNKVKITIKQQEVEANSDQDEPPQMPTNQDNAKTLFTTDMEITAPKKKNKNHDANSKMFAQLITELHAKQMSK